MAWNKLDPTLNFTRWDGQVIEGGTIWDVPQNAQQTYWDLKFGAVDNWTKLEAE